MATSDRGFAKMPTEKVKSIAHQGGQASPTKFKPGEERAKAAGRKGGLARANDPDVKSGELGRQGAAARWGKSEETEEE